MGARGLLYMSINQIATPLDSATLETKEQYQTYFKIVTHAFDELVTIMAKLKICSPLEANFVKQYCELLTYSLEAFRIKYLYDKDEKMRIDLTESGFPNYLEFRYLYNDLELKHDHISKLPKTEVLKAEFLETLMKHKQPISERKLEQASSIIYYSSVQPEFIFKKFVQGKILPTTSENEGEYLVSWSFYDVILNRPFVCFMYFDLEKVAIEDYKQQIYEVLEEMADRNIDLDMIAYAVDKKLQKLHPKKFKKIDLGPLHSVFAKDELVVTHTVLKAIASKALDLSAFALSLQMDETISTGTFSEGNFFNKQQLQVWSPTKVNTYLMAPHRVIQVFYDNIPEALHLLTEEPIEVPAVKLD